jgi:hypothetical protein
MERLPRAVLTVDPDGNVEGRDHPEDFVRRELCADMRIMRLQIDHHDRPDIIHFSMGTNP